MTNIGFVARGMVLAAASCLAVGCCDQEKKQIGYLSNQNAELGKARADLQAQLASARGRESDLTAQIDSRGLEITALKTENADLKQSMAAAPPAPPAPPTAPRGGERTVYFASVGSDVLFSAGSATLTPAGKKELDRIASDIRSRHPGLTVRVVGYTDSDPIVRTKNLWQDNLDLSCNRAMAVTRYLESKGLKAANIETIGMGATHFVASNGTKDGKAKNRRVDIAVVNR